MKFFLHFPLFLVILVIYNLALVANRNGFQQEPATAAPPAVAPAPAATAPAPAATAPAPADVPGPGAVAPQAAPNAAETPAATTPPAPSISQVAAVLTHPLDKGLFAIPLPSGAKMPVSTHEFLLILAVIFLYLELFKSTRTSNATIVEHVFSLLVFMAFFVELIVHKPAGTPTFLIMTLLSFLDVIAGFTITISTARRDFGLGGHASEAS